MRKSYNIKLLNNWILTLAILTLPFMAQASKIKLYKDIKLETLRMWLNTEGLANQQLAGELQDIFKKEIINFNHSSEATYKVEIDTTNTSARVIFNMGPINYVNGGRNFATTALDVGILAGHALLIANYGFTIPVWPLFMPKTNSLVDVSLDPETFRPASQMEILIGKNGYLSGIDRQNKNFKIKFGKVIAKQLQSINKQNIKNSEKPDSE